MTTHYIFEAEELFERVAIMHKGKIISCDTVANLRRNLQRYDEVVITCGELTEEVIDAIRAMPGLVSCEFADGRLTLQLENIQNNLLEILKNLRGHGVSITEIATKEPTLEDIFVDTINAGGKQ